MKKHIPIRTRAEIKSCIRLGRTIFSPGLRAAAFISERFLAIAVFLSVALCFPTQYAAAAESTGAASPRTFVEQVIVTDGSWRVSRRPETGWKLPGFSDKHWKKATSDCHSNLATISEPLVKVENILGFETSAVWVWHPQTGGTVYIRKEFEVDEINRAELAAMADDDLEVYINGVHVGRTSTDQGWALCGTARLFNVEPFLKKGTNSIAFVATDKRGAMGVAAELRINGPPIVKMLSLMPESKSDASVTSSGYSSEFKLYTLDELKSFYAEQSAARSRRNTVRLLKAMCDRGKKDKTFVQKFFIVMSDSSSRMVRRDIAAGMSLIESKKLLPVALDMLDAPPDDLTTMYLVDYIAEAGNASHVAKLRKMLAELSGEKKPDREFRQLITELGAEDYDTRENATRALLKKGLDAEPFLKEAFKTEKDLEIRFRIRFILKKLSNLERKRYPELVKRSLERAVKKLERKKK